MYQYALALPPVPWGSVTQCCGTQHRGYHRVKLALDKPEWTGYSRYMLRTPQEATTLYTTNKDIRPLTLSSEYRCYDAPPNDIDKFDWYPVDSYSAVPYQPLLELADDYDEDVAVTLILAAMQLELSEVGYAEMMNDVQPLLDECHCPYSLVGYLQGYGYLTPDV